VTTVAGSASPQSMIDSRYPESAGPMSEGPDGQWLPGAPGPRPVTPPALDGATRDRENAEATAEAERKAALDAAMKAAAETIAAQQAAAAPAPARRTAAASDEQLLRER
jgi:hypothetical protein